MTALAEAPVSTREAAEQRLAAIRVALDVADEQLAAAYAAEDWTHFGLTSFEDYCAQLLPEMRHIKLRAPERRARAARLYAKGATEKAVARATGASLGTAHNDAVFLGHSKMSAEASRGVSAGEQAPLASREMERQPGTDAATEDAGPAVDAVHGDVVDPTGRVQVAADPTHVVVARAIASCGVAGGTTLEVMEQLGWRQGPASVALSRAARKGLVAATGQRRHATGASPGFAVYVAI